MQRRHRLTRSQDFDAVYRRGRSVSTRFLVLYVFPREEEEASTDPAPAEPRLGLAVPKRIGTAVARNRIKRRLRELWRSRLDVVAPGCDYILVVRPGLVEAAETRGHAWLGDRLDEVLGKAGA